MEFAMLYTKPFLIEKQTNTASSPKELQIECMEIFQVTTGYF
jgi:hypothetical protein